MINAININIITTAVATAAIITDRGDMGMVAGDRTQRD